MKGSYPSRDVSIVGSVIGSVIGDRNCDVEITVAGKVDTDSLERLRKLIALLPAQIEAARGGDPVDSRIQYELETIEDELGDDEPDGKVINSRWKQVLKLLGPLQDMAGVAQTTASILSLFGGT